MSSSCQDKSESELIERAQEGSLEAFEALVIRYQDRLFRFLVARCSSRADAEDVLQEAFVAAWRYLASYRSKWAFSTWLYRIAQRQAAGLARRRPPRPNADGVPADPTEGHTAMNERRVQLWQSVRSCLPEGQSTALWLYYVEEMPVREIATVMGRPPTWIKVNLFRARARLAVELDRSSVHLEQPMIAPEAMGELE